MKPIKDLPKFNQFATYKGFKPVVLNSPIAMSRPGIYRTGDGDFKVPSRPGCDNHKHCKSRGIEGVAA